MTVYDSDNSETTNKRRRLQRDSAFRRIVPTASDDQVLELLAEYKYLRTSHIQALTGRSLRTLNKRLQGLYHQGYVERVDPKTEVGAPKNAEFIYRLDRRGAQRVPRYREGGRRLPKPKAPHPLFFTHDMMVVDFLVNARIACDNSNGRYRFVPEDEYLAQAKLREPKRNPLLLVAPTLRNEHTTPDGLFGIEFRENQNRKLHFFLEADRGTEPGQRTIKEHRGRRLSDVEGKYRVYNNYREFYAREENKPSREFPFANFKVVFVTLSEERTQNLVNKLIDLVPMTPKDDKPGQRGWLFTHKAALFDKKTDFFEHQWLNGQRDRVSILGR